MLTTAGRWGAAMWLVQPLYLVTEFITAAKVTVPYTFAGNTISELGAVSCTSVGYSGEDPVQVCSPWHALMNTSFIVSGLLLAGGAILLRRWLPAGKRTTTAVVLWVISGLSSVGTGLVPLDQNLTLHGVVSLPAFLAQPVALILLGLALRPQHRGLAWSGLLAGVISSVGTVAFIVGSSSYGGLLERLSLWPAYVWVTALAIVALRPSAQSAAAT